MNSGISPYPPPGDNRKFLDRVFARQKTAIIAN